MAISCGRWIRALVAALLVLVLVGTGAMPAAAGPPGPAGSGGGRHPGGSQGGGGHTRGVTAQQAGGSSAPATRRSEGAAPRPSRPRAAAPRPAARPAAAPKPDQPAAHPSEPAKQKPQGNRHRPARDDHGPRQQVAQAPVARPTTAVRASTARRTVAAPDRPVPLRTAVRPDARVVASSVDPTASLFAAPAVLPVQAAAVELEPRQLWPRLPGAAGHPAFPGLLAAVLVGFIVLGIRGDRDDPKLAVAAIDDRGERAAFR